MATNVSDDNAIATPHFVLVPLMAQGHMIPMVDFARQLAEHGVLATVITTPYNLARYRSTVECAEAAGLPLRFVSLPFPCAEVGLPEGCENLDILPSRKVMKSFFQATSLLGPPLEAYLRTHSAKPTCIITDPLQSWTSSVANALGVPLVGFSIFNCFYLLCDHIVRHLDDVSETEPFVVPGLPHRIEITLAQAPGFFSGPDWVAHRDSKRKAEEASVGLVVNSCHDVEPWYVEAYEKAMGKKVWTVGPLSLYNGKAGDVSTRGKDATIDLDRCRMWLDSKEAGSVVYVSFGTIAQVSLPQLMEIGLGLEATGRPFIWVVKEAEMTPEVSTWLTDVFEERVKERGLIIRGWAPQVMILSHPALGGLVTHCGWNSAFEGIVAGLPMVTWPFFCDQFLNERLIVEVMRIGVRVGVESLNLWTVGSDTDAPIMVGRDKVEAAVRLMMDGGVEAEERRERARELGRKAREAVEKGGSSHSDITLFIETISKMTCHQIGEKEKNDI